jgi:hypothetical protein
LRRRAYLAYKVAQALVDRARTIVDEYPAEAEDPGLQGRQSSRWIPVGHDNEGMFAARVEVDNNTRSSLPGIGWVDGSAEVTFARWQEDEDLSHSAKIKESTRGALENMMIPDRPDGINDCMVRASRTEHALDSIEESLRYIEEAL